MQPLKVLLAVEIFFMLSKMVTGSDSSDVQLRNISLMMVVPSKWRNMSSGTVLSDVQPLNR